MIKETTRLVMHHYKFLKCDHVATITHWNLKILVKTIGEWKHVYILAETPVDVSSIAKATDYNFCKRLCMEDRNK